MLGFLQGRRALSFRFPSLDDGDLGYGEELCRLLGLWLVMMWYIVPNSFSGVRALTNREWLRNL